MKRYATIITLVLVALSCLSPLAQAGGEVPYIALTYVPEYGDANGQVFGRIFYDSGEALGDAFGDYRITLYLQLYEGDTYYVKPYYATPYVECADDGTFAIDCTTGGQDSTALIYTVMLVSSSYTPTSSYREALAEALDVQRVVRDADGGYTVDARTQRPEPTRGEGDGDEPIAPTSKATGP